MVATPLMGSVYPLPVTASDNQPEIHSIIVCMYLRMYLCIFVAVKRRRVKKPPSLRYVCLCIMIVVTSGPCILILPDRKEPWYNKLCTADFSCVEKSIML